MKNRLLFVLLFLVLVVFISGCTTAGSFLSQHTTSVELSEDNFKIVAQNVAGNSSAAYLIGVSYSTGFLANTFALARVGGSEKLYDDAIKDLWKNYEMQHGDTEGKNLVLVNVRYDTDILNLFVYTQTKLFITADVVEFTK